MTFCVENFEQIDQTMLVTNPGEARGLGAIVGRALQFLIFGLCACIDDECILRVLRREKHSLLILGGRPAASERAGTMSRTRTRPMSRNDQSIPNATRRCWLSAVNSELAATVCVPIIPVMLRRGKRSASAALVMVRE